MGWGSCSEDIDERKSESFRRSEDKEESQEVRKDAEAYKILELATSPDLDLAREIVKRDERVNTLEDFLKAQEIVLKAKDIEIEELKRKADDCDKQRRRAERGNTKLKMANSQLNEKYEKVLRNNFGAAVDIYSSPSMIRKHKLNR